MKQGVLKKLQVQLPQDIVATGVEMAAWDITGLKIFPKKSLEPKDALRLRPWSPVTGPETDLWIPSTLGKGARVLLRIKGCGIVPFQKVIWHEAGIQTLAYGAGPKKKTQVSFAGKQVTPSEASKIFFSGKIIKQPGLVGSPSGIVAQLGPSKAPISKDQIFSVLEEELLAKAKASGIESMQDEFLQAIVGFETSGTIEPKLMAKVKQYIDVTAPPPMNSGPVDGINAPKVLTYDQAKAGQDDYEKAKAFDIGAQTADELYDKMAESGWTKLEKPPPILDEVVLKPAAEVLAAQAKAIQKTTQAQMNLNSAVQKLGAGLDQTIGQLHVGPTKDYVKNHVLSTLKDVLPVGVLPSVTVEDCPEPGMMDISIQAEVGDAIPWQAQCNNCFAQIAVKVPNGGSPSPSPCPCCGGKGLLVFAGGGVHGTH